MKTSLTVVLLGLALVVSVNAGFMNGHGNGIGNGRGGPDMQERHDDGNHYGWNHGDFSGNGHRGGPINLPGDQPGRRGVGGLGDWNGEPPTNNVPDAGAMLAFIVLAAGGLGLLRRR